MVTALPLVGDSVKVGKTLAVMDTGYFDEELTEQYDLLIGNINEVHYQPGMAGQFFHRYEYDAENKLTDVYTTDVKALVGIATLEEHDARYTYYKHGPLARTVLGQQQVQGIDYAYNLQGWIKGVNSDSIIDKDGQPGSVVARDAYRFSLNYFNGDYEGIGAEASVAFPAHSSYFTTPTQEYRPLYNGNISSMVVGIPKLGETKLYNYGYDQLNRIVSMDAWGGYNTATLSWADMTSSDEYKERIAYDGNGNILKYLRNGASPTLGMDSLSYAYNLDGNGHLENNRLRHVRDAIGNDNYTVDIDNQEDDNYEYDAIGNLIKDTKEGITNIEWTVYGKIKKITKANGTIINYTYDVSGNRISKAVTTEGTTTTTWYNRDGKGNTMAVYTEKASELTLGEHHLYGSTRLGLWDRNIDMSIPAITNSELQRGDKYFELSNHLGNVLVTISDKKTGIDTDTNGDIDYYTSDVVTATDYYPFGMQMVGRTFKANSTYRYGFNGKENDNDVKGEGNSQDYGMRIYDPRLGRFLSEDPLSASFSMLTPYQFASNRPIDGIDLDGLEYLNATLSKIDINIHFIEFNGRKVVSAGVFLDRSKMSRATIGFLDSEPATSGVLGGTRACIGGFKSVDYDFIYDEILQSFKPKQPEAGDATANSLTQPELNILRVPKNKAQLREIEKSNIFYSPSGVTTGSLKGNAIIAMVEVAGILGEELLKNSVKSDFSDARSQLFAAEKVANDIQIGFDNNLFEDSDLQNLTWFANYLLDGKEPTMLFSTKQKNGEEKFYEVTDTKMLERFGKLKDQIIKKRAEGTSQNNCSPCMTEKPPGT